MNLTDIIKLIQGEIGVQRDGVFGPVSAANVLASLQARHMAASFGVVALVTLSSVAIFARLKPDAGAEVSGAKVADRARAEPAA